MCYYVVDTYDDPLGERSPVECASMRAARKLACEFNANPPWPAWDTIQEARDKENRG